MVCFTIIFLSLLECIVVDRLWRRAKADKIQNEQKTGDSTQRTNPSKVKIQKIIMCIYLCSSPSVDISLPEKVSHVAEERIRKNLAVVFFF